LIASFKALQELRECNGCEVEIGKALGVDVVIVGWVQKVSNLILNINIRATDAHSGAALYARSVDLRSNNDQSWLRGIRYMVDGIAEEKDYLR
jgi:TolB-like protein